MSQDTSNKEPIYPWDDDGEDVVVDNQIASKAQNQPFEIYFYQPVSGYGNMMFTDQGIALKFPKGVGSAFGGGNFHISFDFDGDGSFDADDLGCLAAIGAMIGIGYLFKKLTKSNLERMKIIKWSTLFTDQDIKELPLEGRTIKVVHVKKNKPKLELRVAVTDGERLYRELDRCYPSSVAKWKYTLREMTDNPLLHLPNQDGF